MEGGAARSGPVILKALDQRRGTYVDYVRGHGAFTSGVFVSRYDRGYSFAMTTSVRRSNRVVGDLLREWRQHRRYSQLALAYDAEISPKHLSFVESVRSHLAGKWSCASQSGWRCLCENAMLCRFRQDLLLCSKTEASSAQTLRACVEPSNWGSPGTSDIRRSP